MIRGRLIVLVAVAATLIGSSAPNRKRAIERGLRFIYSTSCDPKNFADFGEDYLWCFYSIGATSRDPALARMAQTMGQEKAAIWRRDHPDAPANATAAEIADLAFGSYAAEQLGLPGDRLKDQIRRAAPLHSAQEYLAFDPLREPPPADLPLPCVKCAKLNRRGASVCRHCGAALKFRSRYDVWCDALIVTYTGDHYGVPLGAPYSAVIRWLPAMRPYRGREEGTNPEYYETLYAVTHAVYTLNGYSKFRLSPQSLPVEFAYLEANVAEALAAHDPETMGELLDSLKSFGLNDSDPLVRTGTEYLLATQNPDGSWGDRKTSDVYTRYHSTWTAIDGLRDYAWSAAK
jgi:hypothetical protein